MIVLISTIFKENETKVFLMKMFILELPSDCNVRSAIIHQTSTKQLIVKLDVFCLSFQHCT